MAELSTGQILKAVKAVKANIQSLSNGNGVLRYEIWVKNPILGEKETLYAKRTSKECNIYETFDVDIDNLLDNESISDIKIKLMNGRGQDLGVSVIRLREPYSDDKKRNLGLNLYHKEDEKQNEAKVDSQQEQQKQFGGMNFSGMLNLMGFGSMLNGTEENDAFGGLGAILNVRDAMLHKEIEQKNMLDRYETAVKDNAELQAKVNSLENELAEKNSKIEELQGQIDENEDELEELDKLRDKRNLLGSIGTFAINKFVSAKADKIGGLFGIDGDTIRSVLNEEPQEQVQGAERTEQQQPQSERSQKEEMIAQFIETLTDDEFSSLFDLMNVFAQQKSAILACKKWALGASDENE